MKRRLLFLTDPWNTLDHARDTTLRVIEECLKLKIEVHWAESKSVRWQDGKVRLDSKRVKKVGPVRDAADFHFAEVETRSPADFSHLFYRNDPPVDETYLYPLQLLVLGVQGSRAKILNRPEVLFSSNEKTEFFPLRKWMPETLVSSSESLLTEFIEKNGAGVLKPINSAQSKGVHVLKTGLFNQNLAKIREATSGGTVPAVMQAYLAGIATGETRLWFAGGKLIATARKLPKTGEAVINMDQGGSVVAHELDARERKAARDIGQYLKKRKILWAAVDLIDGKITDFNFTSPGLLTQLERIEGKNLARELIRAAFQAK